MRTFFLTLLLVLSLVLSACETNATPPALGPTAEATGLEFRVDPQMQEVTVIEPNMDAASIAQLQAQAEGEQRLLVQGEDIRFKNFSFQFNSPNKLVVLLDVENITNDLDFAQPFFFTLSSTSNNVVEAVAPLVTDAQLGGDGVLSPGETSEPFRFEVTFKEGEPFAFFVDANAKVVGAADCTNPVSIPDENLEAVIRDALSKQEGELTCADLESLEELEVVNRLVANLEGLQFAVNLTRLNLDLNDVSDLSPLEPLAKLEVLFLGGNEISDLTPLENLTNLSELDLTRNNFSDISPLAGLTNLTFLRLNNNTVNDLSPLENLTNLRDLRLLGNTVSDPTFLENLTNLTLLNLSSTGVNDLSLLENLTSLERLSLTDNDISDVSPLRDLFNFNLRSVNLRCNNISDISPLVNGDVLNQGDFLNLVDNPLSAQALEDIETLRDRGVGVTFSFGG